MKVIFFPRQDYPVEICAHRHGKVMTYTEQTDYFNINSVPIAEMAKSKGIHCGCFSSFLYDEQYNDIMKQYASEGVLWLDLYFYSLRAAQHEVITEDEFNEMLITNLDFFYRLTGKKPIALSYTNGNLSYSEYAKGHFLGGRQSDLSYDSDYGVGYGDPNNIPYSIDGYIAKKCTTRFYDFAITQGFDKALERQSAEIDNALSNGGWLHNFTHWHDVGKNNNTELYNQYFDLLLEKNSNNQIYFAGWGEALAYLVYRQLVKEAVMYSPIGHENERLIIAIDARNTLNVDTDLLQVPISVKLSTKGTPLENKQIKSNYNLISLDNGEYIVEIPYSEISYAIIDTIVE